MTDLTPTPSLNPVPQLETNTLALGGTGNPMNLQAQALLNRDAYRAQQIDDLLSGISDETDLEKGAGGVGRAYQSVRSIAQLKSLKKDGPSKHAVLEVVGDKPFFYYCDNSGGPATNNDATTVIGTDGGVWRLNHDGSISVKLTGAKGIGLGFDDSAAFQACANICMAERLKMTIPVVPTFYNVSSGVVIDQRIVIEGVAGGFVNVYRGKQFGGSCIKYSGNGDLFGIDTNDDPAKFAVDGTTIRNLTLFGTANAKYGIRVGRDSDVGVDTKVKSNITLDNIYLGDFKAGRGYAITWCFSNTVRDVVVQNCGVCAGLNFAHGTRLIGGNLEQSLVGLDARTSYAVDVIGTVIQGLDNARVGTFGLSVPSDFVLWSGWDGTGTTGALRNTPLGYAGTGVRNLGSSITLQGNYWEYNNYNILMELDSHTVVQSGIVGLDPITKSFVQIGIGGLEVSGIDFQGGAHVSFQGVFQTERNYAAPCDIRKSNVYAATIPPAKVFTGPQSHVGETNQWDPSAFSMRNHLYSVFENKGQSLAPNSTGTVGNFNLFPYAQSNNIRHILTGTGTTITYVLTDASTIKAQEGAVISLHVISIGTSTVSFGAAFKTTAASYAMAAGKQAIFEFRFSNGQWNMKFAPAILDV